VVTLVGVAYRGNIALEDVAGVFEAEPTCSNDGVGFVSENRSPYTAKFRSLSGYRSD